MTRITAILDRAARQCSITPPDSWITTSTLAHVEMRDDFLLETIEELHKRLDWGSPIARQVTIKGDGVTEDHALPSDFVRITREPNAVYQNVNNQRRGYSMLRDGDWTELKTFGTGGGNLFYKIQGYEGNYTISLYPTLSAGAPGGFSDGVVVSYISTRWTVNEFGAYSDVFDDPNEDTIFPRRILELGIVWRFRRRKGLPFEDVLAEYESWIAVKANENRGNMVVSTGPSANEDTHPMRVPVPDYIPSS